MKKILSIVLVAILTIGMVVPVSAASETYVGAADVSVIDAEGNVVSKTTYTGGTVGAETYFGETVYISLSQLIASEGLDVKDVTNTSKTTVSTKKTTGGSFVSNVEVVKERVNGVSDTYIKLTTVNNKKNDTQYTEVDVRLKAKKDDSMKAGVVQGDTFIVTLGLDISQNEVDSGDLEVNKGVMYMPEEDSDNYLSWYDRNGVVAEYVYKAGNRAAEFYVKLDTNFTEALYNDLAQPAGAEIMVRNFGNVRVNGVRGELKLYNEFEGYGKIADYRIYTTDGTTLTDVTSEFTYHNGAWITTTHVLGNYIIGTKELVKEETPETSEEEKAPEKTEDTENKNTDGKKPNPGTGIY